MIRFVPDRSRWRRFVTIRIRNQRELIVYVVATTFLCAAAALGVDIVSQLTFFIDWPSAIRSWAITVAVVVVIAVPVSLTIGRAHLALYTASRIDVLTGLLNRRALLEGVDEPFTFLALAVVDVDRFKQVNDTHGHLVGDQVLAAVAHVMKLKLGEFGRIGRLGGEEFALLASVCDRDLLSRSLVAFQELLADTPVIAGTNRVSVTVSAGVAVRDRGQTFKELYAEADRALYVAKTSGRNRIVWSDEPTRKAPAPQRFRTD